MITCDRDGGLAATARAEDARRPSARADATELRAWSEAQWKCWLAARCDRYSSAGGNNNCVI